MTEFQKIAIGLLGLSHPEIYLLAQRAPQERAEPAGGLAPDGPSAAKQEPAPKVPRSGGGADHAGALMRGLKFAFAALLAGSRIVPLGDNRRLTKELGEYGARLHRCS
jgi:hypothetical protein